MRNAFAQQIELLAERDDRVVLLSGDIGNRMFDRFKERFAGRFYNCGVAEANMIGMAAGLAMCGLRPVAYTIAPFITYRCLEQIRIDLCYHRLPVIIAGVGAGLGYASLGATHHACEDIAVLRALPEMTVLCPADAYETRAALAAALTLDGPAYLRLGKKGEPAVHAQPIEDFAIGRAITLRHGFDVCLLGCGVVMPMVLEAAEHLAARRLRPRVVSCHTVKPLDAAMLAELVDAFDLIVTVEEHSVVGGFGAAVAEWLADRGPCRAHLLRIGAPDAFVHEAGPQSHARQHVGLTVAAIAERVAAWWNRQTRENQGNRGRKERIVA